MLEGFFLGLTYQRQLKAVFSDTKHIVEDHPGKQVPELMVKGGDERLYEKSLYGLSLDKIGIGYAYLNGADDGDFDYSQVAEVYWRFVLNDYFAITADLQYIKDRYRTMEMEDIDGIIGGIRMTAEF